MSDTELPDDLQGWTAKRRAALVMTIQKRSSTPFPYWRCTSLVSMLNHWANTRSRLGAIL
ncbi:hypothetical protein GC173_00255 [bacterium]|nr:hypothetical protein [bacterium]